MSRIGKRPNPSVSDLEVSLIAAIDGYFEKRFGLDSGVGRGIYDEGTTTSDTTSDVKDTRQIDTGLGPGHESTFVTVTPDIKETQSVETRSFSDVSSLDPDVGMGDMGGQFSTTVSYAPVTSTPPKADTPSASDVSDLDTDVDYWEGGGPGGGYGGYGGVDTVVTPPTASDVSYLDTDVDYGVGGDPGAGPGGGGGVDYSVIQEPVTVVTPTPTSDTSDLDTGVADDTSYYAGEPDDSQYQQPYTEPVTKPADDTPYYAGDPTLTQHVGPTLDTSTSGTGTSTSPGGEKGMSDTVPTYDTSDLFNTEPDVKEDDVLNVVSGEVPGAGGTTYQTGDPGGGYVSPGDPRNQPSTADTSTVPVDTTPSTDVDVGGGGFWSGVGDVISGGKDVVTGAAGAVVGAVGDVAGGVKDAYGAVKDIVTPASTGDLIDCKSCPTAAQCNGNHEDDSIMEITSYLERYG